MTQQQTATAVRLAIPSVVDIGQQNLPVPAQPAGAVTSSGAPGAQHTQDVPAPEWMSTEQQTAVQTSVGQFMAVIRQNPTDAKIVKDISSIGEQGDAIMTPAMTLYNTKVGEALGNLFTEDGGKVNATLLQVKRELDKVNPSVVKRQKVPFRFLRLFFPLLSRLPKGDEVLERIHGESETVGTLVSGIKAGLYAERDKIQAFVGEVTTVYDQMVAADRQDEGEVYFGQCLLAEVDAFRVTLRDERSVANMEEVQATLQRQVNMLRDKRIINTQTFQGAISFMRNARMQLENLKRYASFEQALLASLGIKVASRALAQSQAITTALSEAISQTMADTAEEQKELGLRLMKGQKSSLLDLDKVEKACRDYDDLFHAIEGHNRAIITEGAKVGERLQGILKKQSARIERGHSIMKGNQQ